MDILLEWAFFVFVPFATAAATLLIWSRAGHAGYAVAGGTLTGVTVTWIVSALYWSGPGPTVCEQCLAEGYSVEAAVAP